MKYSIIKTIAIVGALLLSGCASNSKYKVVKFNVTSKVIEVKRAPDMCTDGSEKTSAGHVIAGATILGLAANQIGGGSGKDWATAAGIIGGGALGASAGRKPDRKITCKKDGYVAMVMYRDPVDYTTITDFVHLKKSTKNDSLTIPVYRRVLKEEYYNGKYVYANTNGR